MLCDVSLTTDFADYMNNVADGFTGLINSLCNCIVGHSILDTL